MLALGSATGAFASAASGALPASGGCCPSPFAVGASAAVGTASAGSGGASFCFGGGALSLLVAAIVAADGSWVASVASVVVELFSEPQPETSSAITGMQRIIVIALLGCAELGVPTRAVNVNAVAYMLSIAPRAVARRLAGRSLASDDAERVRAAGRFGHDLASFLNTLRRAELDAVAAELGVECSGRIGVVRKRLWMWGARAEAGTEEWVGTQLQPEPRELRGKLVFFRAQPGVAPPPIDLPRGIPEPVDLPSFASEPETLEQLLDRASALIGLRLGQRGRDKGAYGARIAALLGVIEDGFSEPDWRGEVELKTLPVVRDRTGLWWVKEDPAVSMETARPMAKLARVLWIARVADDDESPVLSWFYQENSESLTRLIARDLHTRPKGGAGATTRGWYLHKRFFLDSGLLATLNG